MLLIRHKTYAIRPSQAEIDMSRENPIYALYPLAACCQLKGRRWRKPLRPLWY